MIYLTPVHWIVLAIFLLLWLLSIVLMMRNNTTKIPFLALLTSIVIAVLIAISSMYILDSYVHTHALGHQCA